MGLTVTGGGGKGADAPGVPPLLLLGVGVSVIGGGEGTIVCERGEGSASPGDAFDGGRLCRLEARDWWLGRRGGGGAGAWMLTRRLEERDRVESTEDRRSGESVSSCCIAKAALGVTLLSDRPCGCRLGGGAGFLLGCGVAAGTLTNACDTFGGVGGLGMIMFRPGCISASGSLPAASRSNTLSESSSAGDFSGASGRGLLTSDGVGGLCRDGGASGRVAVLRAGLDNGGGVPLAGAFSSPPAPGRISFPCRELGGGGFFLIIVGAGCKLD